MKAIFRKSSLNELVAILPGGVTISIGAMNDMAYVEVSHNARVSRFYEGSFEDTTREEFLTQLRKALACVQSDIKKSFGL